MGYPVSVIKPALNYKDTFNPVQFMVNVGLALKGQQQGAAGNQYSMIDFNALPQAYQTPAFSWTRVLMPVGAVIAVGLLVYAGLALASLKRDTSSLVKQYDVIQAQTARLRADNKQAQEAILAEKAQSDALSADATAIEGQITQTQANEAVFNNLLNSLKLGLDNSDKDMKEAINLVPAGVSLTSVEYQTDGMHISGATSSQSLILVYARALRSGGRFESVTVASIESLADGTFSFTIILR